jgi:choline monooxygenase
MRTTDITEEIREHHSNAEKFRIDYPETVFFPEQIVLTSEEALIPTSAYTSQEYLKAELEKVWYRTWQMVCRAEEVARSGDYYEYAIGDQSFLIVRAEDGALRAFRNACRHRGTQLKQGTGNARNLTCTYHAWCWSLQGDLKNIPDRRYFPTVTDEAYRLREVMCDTWAGFVFIHPDPQRAQPLREFLGRVADDIDVYHMDRYRATSHAVIQLECNWKAALEAFIEAYHVSFTHPQLASYLDDVNTTLEVFGDHSRMIVPYGVPTMRIEHVDTAEIYESYFNKSATSFRHAEAAKRLGQSTTTLPPELFDEHGNWKLEQPIREYLMDHASGLGEQFGHNYSELTRAQLVDDYDYHIFPGFKFNSHAGACLGFRSRPHPTDPNKCVFDVYTLVWLDENAGDLPESVPAAEVDISKQSMGQVLDQDFGNLARVQRGLHDSTLEHVTFGGAEVRITNFHSVINRMIADD